ncbi:MAG: glycerophosphodiester phosphodiesterase family protein [Halieaceae bacterium]|nr:glycerophosphodiester phosphodiesterase family protein [Halieaceae bacterium]
MIVYGHRGARGEAPENTIAGARHAVARGARHLEIDLRLSADGQLVVVHDATLKRTAGVTGKVSASKASDLAKLDARADGPAWPNKRNTGIPSMTALHRALPEIKHWQLELKSLGERDNPALAAATVDWLRKHKPRAVVTSSEPNLLKAVKTALPRQALGYVSTTTGPESVLEDCDCDYLIAHWQTLVSRAQVRKLQRRGIHISAWTVNDASVIKQLYKLGIDSVITDYPSMALPLVSALSR